MSFKVYINQGEWDQICAWVLKYQNIETGGDLFGLWLDEQTAVVQFVLGPGEKSKRTTISFFQDVDYLREAGMYLTKYHGLCNVGQWHSHHKINLFKPSAGDENTVWSNMPNLGLDRYIVFIANIPNEVTINCFLFQIKKGKQLSVKHGEFKILRGNSPMRLNEKVLQNVHNGAESFNQITVFEKEMNYIRNEDAMENLDISNKNEYETSSYAANRVQHVAGVSVERATTPSTTSDQGSKRHNYPTTPKDKQKQRDLKDTTPKSSDSKPTLNAAQKSREQHIDKNRNKHLYPTTRQTTEGAQQLQSANVKFKGTDSQAINVIVTQPDAFRGLGRFPGSLKRKSGDYDNVKSDNELPQHKKNKPNSLYIPSSEGKPSEGKPEEVIHESSSSPSGTFKSSEVRHKFKQTEVTNDMETTGSSWTRLYNSVCCGMSKLSTNEPEVQEIRLTKVEAKEGSKISYV